MGKKKNEDQNNKRWKRRGYTPKEWVLLFDWLVENIWWWGLYKVKLENGMITDCKVKWRLRKFKVKIVLWDTVQVELNEFDPTKGYIVYRK